MKHLSLSSKSTVTVFFRTKFIFLFLFYAFFLCFPWQYLPEIEVFFVLFFFAFMSFPLIWHHLCSCKELLLMMHACFIVSLPLSVSLIGHVSSTSCQTSGGGRSPNVNVWMTTGTLVVGTSNRQYTWIVHIFKFCRELSIESWSLDRLHCLFGTAGLKVVIKWSDFQFPWLYVHFGTFFYYFELIQYESSTCL